MTGEITLRGKVLAIGGLKEKLLAALRAGIFEVILPRANEKDIAELPDNIKNSMKLYFVDQMDEVLKLALEGPLPTALPDAVDVLTAVPTGDLRRIFPRHSNTCLRKPAPHGFDARVLLRCNWKIQDSQLIANFAEVPRAGFANDPLGGADSALCKAAAAVASWRISSVSTSLDAVTTCSPLASPTR